MTTALIDDPVLMLVRSALDRLYGDQIERVILFGSRARGEARRIPTTISRSSFGT